MPYKKQKISGLLNNCSLNCGLPLLLQDIAKLAELEKNDRLPRNVLHEDGFEEAKFQVDENDEIYKNFCRLKEIFCSIYELDEKKLTWQSFNQYLTKYNNFYAIQIIFLPVLRSFINEDINFSIKHARTFLKIQDDGKYSKLEVQDAFDYFYKKFGINVQEIQTSKAENGTINNHRLVDECKAENIPTWLTKTDQNNRLVEMYIPAVNGDHFEMSAGDEYSEIYASQNDEVNKLGPLESIFLKLSNTTNISQTQEGLSELKKYIKADFNKENSIFFQIFISSYFQLAMTALLVASALTLTALLISSGQLPTAIASFVSGLSITSYQALLGSSIAVIATSAPSLTASVLTESKCGLFGCGESYNNQVYLFSDDNSALPP